MLKEHFTSFISYLDVFLKINKAKFLNGLGLLYKTILDLTKHLIKKKTITIEFFFLFEFLKYVLNNIKLLLNANFIYFVTETLMNLYQLN